jgi:guanylate kinase
MSGKLILVSGVAGAGKTTLISYALRVLPGLLYLKTYTTRPMRAGEEKTHEYIFVTDDQYAQLRAASSHWDHTEYASHFYGADTRQVKDELTKGRNVICSVAPDITVIREMAALYEVNPITIWIDTPADIAKLRTRHDTLRKSREDNHQVSRYFDYIYKPSNSLLKDRTTFVDLLRAVTR